MYSVSFPLTLDDFRKALPVVDGACTAAAEPPSSLAARCLARFLAELPLAVISVLLIAPFLTEFDIPSWYALLVAFATLAAAFSCEIRWRNKSFIRHVERLFVNNMRCRSSSTVSLREDEVEVAFGSTRVIRPWSAFSGISLAGPYVLLLVDDTAEFIPVQAFVDEKALHDFLRFAAMKIAHHTPAGREGVL